jgi:ribosomal protein L22
MSARDPKGTAKEPEQDAAAQATREAAVEKAGETAEASAAAGGRGGKPRSGETGPAKKPRSRSRARKAAEPEAAGAAAAQTGVDKAAVKPARRARERQTTPAVLVTARARYVRMSPRKVRLVCDHIRGKDVQEARAILAFTPRSAARDLSKLLESAVANAEHNHELVGEDLRIHAVIADTGPTIKRFRPRAMGRATRIRKRTSHLTITLTPKES